MAPNWQRFVLIAIIDACDEDAMLWDIMRTGGGKLVGLDCKDHFDNGRTAQGYDGLIGSQASRIMQAIARIAYNCIHRVDGMMCNVIIHGNSCAMLEEEGEEEDVDMGVDATEKDGDEEDGGEGEELYLNIRVITEAEREHCVFCK